MRPFFVASRSSPPPESSHHNTLQGRGSFHADALSRPQLPAAGSSTDLPFMPQSGWSAASVPPSFVQGDRQFGAHVWANNAGNADPLQAFDGNAEALNLMGVEDDWAEFPDFVPSQNPAPRAEVVSFLPLKAKEAISARLATAPIDDPDIFKTIADDVLQETGFAVTEEDVQRQLDKNRIEAQAVLNSHNNAPQSVTHREYIPEGGGNGIRIDAEGRISSTKNGILLSELPALLAPYEQLPPHAKVTDPENEAKTIQVTSLRQRLRQRVLIPDPQDDTKLIRKGTVKARRSDRQVVVDAEGHSELVSLSTLRQRRYGRKQVEDPRDTNKTIKQSTLKYVRYTKQLEEAQKNIDRYPIGFIGANNERNFRPHDIIRDPQNPQKVIFGHRLLGRVNNHTLMPDKVDGGFNAPNITKD